MFIILRTNFFVNYLTFGRRITIINCILIFILQINILTTSFLDKIKFTLAISLDKNRFDLGDGLRLLWFEILFLRKTIG